MKANQVNHDLLQYLSRTRSISVTESAKLVDEILSYFNETSEVFIRRRHHELQESGLSNSTIYQLIRKELKAGRFLAPSLSDRQVRRVIYG